VLAAELTTLPYRAGSALPVEVLDLGHRFELAWAPLEVAAGPVLVAAGVAAGVAAAGAAGAGVAGAGVVVGAGGCAGPGFGVGCGSACGCVPGAGVSLAAAPEPLDGAPGASVAGLSLVGAPVAGASVVVVCGAGTCA
jgi:hypothetical protein